MVDAEIAGRSIFQLREEFKDPVFGGKQLESISIFRNFVSSELQDLYKLGEIKSFHPQVNVVVEGESTRGLYVILHGTLSVYKNDSSKNTMIRLTYLEAGSYFGEMSLFDGAARSATVVAESNCHLFYLDISVFDEFLDKVGDDLKVRFYKQCAEEMAVRFRVQNSDYIQAQNLLWSHALTTPPKTES